MTQKLYAAFVAVGSAVAVAVAMSLGPVPPEACGEADGWCEFSRGIGTKLTVAAGLLLGAHFLALAVVRMIGGRTPRTTARVSRSAHLEAARSATRSAARTDRPTTLRSGRTALRVALVEDDPAQRLMLGHTITSGGLELAGTYAGAQEALDTLAADRPDVVLTDLFLGDVLNGLDVAAEARAHGIPVVVISVDGRAEAMARAAGAAAFLHKGESPVAIRDTLARVVAESRAAQIALVS